MLGLCPVLQATLGVETVLRLQLRDAGPKPRFEHARCRGLGLAVGFPGIEKDRAEHRLDGIGQRARVLPTTALEITTTEVEELTQPQRPSNLDQGRLGDQRGPQASEFALRKLGEAPPHRIGRDEVEHGIAEELQTRIAGPPGVGVLVGPRAEGQGHAQQPRIGKRVADRSLQGFQVVLRGRLRAITQPQRGLGQPTQDLRKPRHDPQHTPIWTSAAPPAYHRAEAAMKEHIETITDLLLGAAYADKRLEGDELRAITKMVCKLLGSDELPEAQQGQLKAFNPAKFDVNTASSSLASLADDDKKRVLELVASINESDDVIDFDEDAYLRKVATGLGVDESVIAEHTIEILSDEDLDGMLADD